MQFFLLFTENSKSSKGKISWKFFVSDPSISIHAIKICLMASVFHSSAKVRASLTDEDGKMATILGSFRK